MKAPPPVFLLAPAQETSRRDRLAAMLGARGVTLATQRDLDGTLSIDLADFGSPLGSGPPGLRLMADGRPGLAAIGMSLLGRRAPMLALIDEAGTVYAEALPAVEDWRSLAAAEAPVLARVADLIMAAANAVPPARPSPDAMLRADYVRAWRSEGADMFGQATFATRSLARRVVGRIDRWLHGAPRWCVGWRPLATDRLDGPAPDASGRWTWLPDDPGVYYADPFPIVIDGALHLFVEALPASTGKGVIAHVPIDAAGRPGPITTVLETPTHLSYPQVFRHDGRIMMIPESAAAGDIALYVADPFPDRWVKARVLVAGITASDATLVVADGRVWLMAAEGGAGRSNWDGLALWSAPALDGPFAPHPRNPVLIDASAARPAGPISVAPDGALLRPVQDCRAGYGAGLGFALITAMDPQGFRQTLLHRVAPPAALGAKGLHHHSVAGGYEFVDMLLPRSAGPAP